MESVPWPAEDAGVVATYEEDFEALKIGVGINGIYQHLWRCDQYVEGIFEQGNDGIKFYVHDGKDVALKISGRDVRGAKCNDKEGGRKPKGVKEGENYRLSPNYI
jgi:hypothetical protein